MKAFPQALRANRCWLTWMRGGLGALLLAVFLAGAALAQEKRDGYYWRTIQEAEKLDIILGMFDGMALMENVIAVVLKENYTVCTDVITSIMRQTDSFLDDLTTVQIAERVDRFYERPENRNIPIFWSVWVVARESKGDKTVPRFLRELRKAYK